MGIEIERKFLVRDGGWRAGAGPGVRYRQGYLGGSERCSVRVRLGGERAWLTVKGATAGLQRAEFEYPVPAADARVMLDTLCAGGVVEKTRYVVPHAGHAWEVDVFEGANAGLVIAEVELSDPGEAVALPAWVGAEVSGDPRYLNARLARHPYATWRGA